MTELKPWLNEASDADDFERSILRSGLDADPSPATQDRIWSGLLGSLGVAPLTTATGAKAASAGVSKAMTVGLTVGKGFVVGLAVYGASVGVAEISTRLGTPRTASPAAISSHRAAEPWPANAAREPRPAEPLPSAATAESDTQPAPLAVQPDSAGIRPITRKPPSTNTGQITTPLADGSARTSNPPVSQLQAETRALRQARDELRAGKLADAFATLEASRRQFSEPALYQEREALMIELLSRSGRASAAKERANAFLRRFPESPHVQQVQRFAQ